MVDSILCFIKKQIKINKMILATKKGWSHFGMMLRDYSQLTKYEFERRIRYSNRLYRLGRGKSPWKKYKGY